MKKEKTYRVEYHQPTKHDPDHFQQHYYANLTSAEKGFIRQAVSSQRFAKSGAPRLKDELCLGLSVNAWVNEYDHQLNFEYNARDWRTQNKHRWLVLWARRLGWSGQVYSQFRLDSGQYKKYEN